MSIAQGLELSEESREVSNHLKWNIIMNNIDINDDRHTNDNINSYNCNKV